MNLSEDLNHRSQGEQTTNVHATRFYKYVAIFALKLLKQKHSSISTHSLIIFLINSGYVVFFNIVCICPGLFYFFTVDLNISLVVKI